MKKKYVIILLLIMILMPFKVFASGGFGVSTTSISMYPGESKTIAITTDNAVGKLNISSSNGKTRRARVRWASSTKAPTQAGFL